MFQQQSHQRLTKYSNEPSHSAQSQKVNISVSQFQTDQLLRQQQTSTTVKPKQSRKRKANRHQAMYCQTNIIKVNSTPIQQQQQQQTIDINANKQQNNQNAEQQQLKQRQYICDQEKTQKIIKTNSNHNNDSSNNKIMSLSPQKKDTSILYNFPSQDEDDHAGCDHEFHADYDNAQYAFPQSSRHKFYQQQQADYLQEAVPVKTNTKRSGRRMNKKRERQFALDQREGIKKGLQNKSKRQQYQDKQQTRQKQHQQSQKYYQLQHQGEIQQQQSGQNQNLIQQQLTERQQTSSHLQNQQKQPHPCKQLIVFKSTSFFTLINAPIPQGQFVHCLIRRKRSTPINSFLDLLDSTVLYEMFLLQDKKFLLLAIKNNKLISLNSHFQFYKQRPNPKNNYDQQNLYAVMDANTTGTQYRLKILYKNQTLSEKSTTIDKNQDSIANLDNSQVQINNLINDKGIMKTPSIRKIPNPIKIKDVTMSQTVQTLTQKPQLKQLCFIAFKANLFGLNGQRQIRMLKKKNKKIPKTNKFSDIKQAYYNGQRKKLVELTNKKAQKGKNGLQLDLKEMAKIQSTKNTILIDSEQRQSLIFGKICEDVYAVGIGSPLSILDGLSFGVANLDGKFLVN